ncbi:MAG: hypothetical protein AAF528_09355 [Cyanobacteria bacterium P01_C01_bin.121]
MPQITQKPSAVNVCLLKQQLPTQTFRATAKLTQLQATQLQANDWESDNS